VIHILSEGRPLCGFTNDVPMLWPEGEKWVAVTMNGADCPRCIAVRNGKPLPELPNDTIESLRGEIEELKNHISTLTFLTLKMFHTAFPRGVASEKFHEEAQECLRRGVRIVPELQSITTLGRNGYEGGMRPEKPLDSQPPSAWTRIGDDNT
jgi:hypothetical protein